MEHFSLRNKKTRALVRWIQRMGIKGVFVFSQNYPDNATDNKDDDYYYVYSVNFIITNK